jgi:hypothetical protein
LPGACRGWNPSLLTFWSRAEPFFGGGKKRERENRDRYRNSPYFGICPRYSLHHRIKRVRRARDDGVARLGRAHGGRRSRCAVAVGPVGLDARSAGAAGMASAARAASAAISARTARTRGAFCGAKRPIPAKPSSRRPSRFAVAGRTPLRTRLRSHGLGLPGRRAGRPGNADPPFPRCSPQHSRHGSSRSYTRHRR